MCFLVLDLSVSFSDLLSLSENPFLCLADDELDSSEDEGEVLADEWGDVNEEEPVMDEESHTEREEMKTAIH